jgi:hypothetical protein
MQEEFRLVYVFAQDFTVSRPSLECVTDGLLARSHYSTLLK